MRRIALTVFSIIFLTTGVGMAADLEVEVIGLSSNEGDVHIAVYDTPELFPDTDGMITETHVPISENRAVMIFKNLNPGRYAIAVYHDANGNHDFDQGIFGIPLEDYGFSNDARVFFVPPSFDDAAFELLEQKTKITIRPND